MRRAVKTGSGFQPPSGTPRPVESRVPPPPSPGQKPGVLVPGPNPNKSPPWEVIPPPTPSPSVVSYTQSLQTPPPRATKMYCPNIFDFRARIRNSGGDVVPPNGNGPVRLCPPPLGRFAPSLCPC